jgi:hypothetical protein
MAFFGVFFCERKIGKIRKTVKMADELELTRDKLAKLQFLFGDAMQNFPKEMQAGAERSIRKEMAKESAIEKVFDHFYELELRRFFSDVNETTEEGTFFERLEASILRPLIVMRNGDEEQASVQMRKLWTDQVEKYETERVKKEKVSKKRAEIKKQLDEYYAEKAIVIQKTWRMYNMVQFTKERKKADTDYKERLKLIYGDCDPDSLTVDQKEWILKGAEADVLTNEERLAFGFKPKQWEEHPSLDLTPDTSENSESLAVKEEPEKEPRDVHWSIKKVFDIFFEDEVQHFFEWLMEEPKCHNRDEFMVLLEQHHAYYLLIMRFGEVGEENFEREFEELYERYESERD